MKLKYFWQMEGALNGWLTNFEFLIHSLPSHSYCATSEGQRECQRETDANCSDLCYTFIQRQWYWQKSNFRSIFIWFQRFSDTSYHINQSMKSYMNKGFENKVKLSKMWLKLSINNLFSDFCDVCFPYVLCDSRYLEKMLLNAKHFLHNA